MKKIFFFAVSTAVLMSGCSEFTDDASGIAETNAIDFRPVLEKTRASVVGSTNELTSFFVQADKGTDYDFSFLKASVYKESSSWVYAPKKYYPTDGSSVNFYAYSPVKDVNMTSDLVNTGGSVTIGYTVPNDQSGLNTAADLLVSSKTNVTGGEIDFIFDHALSAVTFSAKNSNATTSELTYVVSNIEITKLYNVGTYTYSGGTSWTSTGSTVTYKAGVPASGVAVVPGGTGATTVNLLSANDVMMVLPQTPTLATSSTPSAGALVAVTFSLKDGGGQYIYQNEVRNLFMPANFAFVKGTRYNFEFEFVASNAIVLNVTSLTGWASTNTPIAQ